MSAAPRPMSDDTQAPGGHQARGVDAFLTPLGPRPGRRPRRRWRASDSENGRGESVPDPGHQNGSRQRLDSTDAEGGRRPPARKWLESVRVCRHGKVTESAAASGWCCRKTTRGPARTPDPSGLRRWQSAIRRRGRSPGPRAGSPSGRRRSCARCPWWPRA